MLSPIEKHHFLGICQLLPFVRVGSILTQLWFSIQAKEKKIYLYLPYFTFILSVIVIGRHTYWILYTNVEPSDTSLIPHLYDISQTEQVSCPRSLHSYDEDRPKTKRKYLFNVTLYWYWTINLKLRESLVLSHAQCNSWALARISELSELGVQFLFIPLHYTQQMWILGCPKSAIGCPKDTRTSLWLKACVIDQRIFDLWFVLDGSRTTPHSGQFPTG